MKVDVNNLLSIFQRQAWVRPAVQQLQTHALTHTPPALAVHLDVSAIQVTQLSMVCVQSLPHLTTVSISSMIYNFSR